MDEMGSQKQPFVLLLIRNSVCLHDNKNNVRAHSHKQPTHIMRAAAR